MRATRAHGRQGRAGWALAVNRVSGAAATNHARAARGSMTSLDLTYVYGHTRFFTPVGDLFITVVELFRRLFWACSE